MKKIDIFVNEIKIFDGPIYIADTFIEKFFGLMGKKKIEKEGGLFFTNTSGIHTHFMNFPIDVVYFDKNKKVIFIETVYPWKIGSFVKNAKFILELNKDIGKKLSLNDKISIVKE